MNIIYKIMIDPNSQCGACVSGGGKKRRLIKNKHTNGKYSKIAKKRTNRKYSKITKKRTNRKYKYKTGKKWRGLGGSVMFQPNPPTNLEITPDFLKI
jgi:hypothetical protein